VDLAGAAGEWFGAQLDGIEEALVAAVEWWEIVSTPIWEDARAAGIVPDVPVEVAVEAIVIGEFRSRPAFSVRAPGDVPPTVSPPVPGNVGSVDVLVSEPSFLEDLAELAKRFSSWLARLIAEFENFAKSEMDRAIQEHPDPEEATASVLEAASPRAAAETLAEQAWRAAYGASQRQTYGSRISKLVWPYLAYRTKRDDRVRPRHRLLEGFIAASDWPGWPAVEPPNGYRCRCRLEPISWEEAKRRGYEGVFPLGDARVRAWLAAGGPDTGFPKGTFSLEVA